MHSKYQTKEKKLKIEEEKKIEEERGDESHGKAAVNEVKRS